jgi:hypothetical protein
MTPKGWEFMSVCELLHCTRSELKKRLADGDGYIDFFTSLAYIRRKNKLEKEAMEKAKR